MNFIGIDIGGTNIAIGIVESNGKLIKKLSIPTPSEENYDVIVKKMFEATQQLLDSIGMNRNEIEAVGIGCPGSIDYKKGRVVYSNNLKMSNSPLCDEFKKYWNIPIVLENDANAAAYGEYMANNEELNVFLAITLGTGVGGGIIINGRIFSGSNGAGGELGHMILVHNGLQCTCGRKGCWETYASATALIRQTKEAINENPQSILAAIAKETGVNGKTAFDAAKKGDETGLRVVNQYLEYVAEGITNMVNIFQPDKIVIGGGISNQGDYMLNPIREFVDRFDYNKNLCKVKIDTAKLKNDAGIVGAALAAKNFRISE